MYCFMNSNIIIKWLLGDKKPSVNPSHFALRIYIWECDHYNGKSQRMYASQGLWWLLYVSDRMDYSNLVAQF